MKARRVNYNDESLVGICRYNNNKKKEKEIENPKRTRSKEEGNLHAFIPFGSLLAC